MRRWRTSVPVPGRNSPSWQSGCSCPHNASKEKGTAGKWTNRQSLHKGASVQSDPHQFRKGGPAPASGLLLTAGFVSHESRHLPVSVSVTNLTQRFSCQISEHQQCETHYQHTPDKGTSWQFHGLLLLAQSAVRGYPDVVRHMGCLVG